MFIIINSRWEKDIIILPDDQDKQGVDRGTRWGEWWGETSDQIRHHDDNYIDDDSYNGDDSNIDDDDCDIGDDTCDDSNGEVMKSNALYSQVEAGALDEESFQRAFEVVSQIF